MLLRIYQVDAFSDSVFSGNPAAVIPLENWLKDELMQQIALENNLSETSFFVKIETGYHIRWFTPVVEVDLCGHATIATAHVLWQHLNYPGDSISFKSRSGGLGVTRDNDYYTLDFPTDKLEKVGTPEIIAQSIGSDPIECYKGREDYLLLFDNQSTIENLTPDFTQLKKLKTRGIIATARGKDVDFVSRCFFPYFGIDEDPVTGSAHTTLAPYWSKRLDKNEMTARQISKRGGYLKCRLAGERTFISGQAVTYLKGEIEI